MPSVFDEAIAACRLAAGINPFGSVENARARDAARRVLELVDGYNLHRVAWELERTALNDGFYGNALRAAKDIPGVTDEERALLDRYATGGIQSMDHCALQRLAMKIDEMADRQRDAADKAKVAEPEPIQAVAFEPSSEQLHGLWDGLSRCLTKTSTINFLRVWIRDWTAHKNGAIAQAMLDAAAGGTGITLGGKRINPASIYKQPEPAQEPVAWMYHGIRHDGTPHDWPSLIWRPEYMDAMSASKGAQATPLYTVPPQHPEPAQEPVAWGGHDLDAMVEAFSRVIEAHYQRANPFQNPIDMDAQMALRALRGFIPAMKAYTAPPQRPPLTVQDLQQALVDTGLIFPEAIDDAEGFDHGVTLERIDKLHLLLVGVGS